MKINTKCSLAIHILISIAMFSDKVKVTSEIIAKSTGTNPVIIRNIFGSLKKAGIIEVRRGSAGAELAMNPSEITLFDIYDAVDPNSLENLIGIHKNPSPKCPVGCKIHDVLEEPYNAVREGIKYTMSQYTLADLLLKYDYKEI
ncbi:MAG: Rrf2 family transcriptional regulator [Intestinibacter bartlettii]|uniref:RrF2 family transcriptional regulator n=1 Tax=Intestinibacter bartlettii TaxID=261299 RepID=UPI0026F025FA|nr:Rrf2 family transcriptional regulator [Intestinibacter bartlettii]MDO5011621.1 Rrf2 family transcriptional regulator [Intestinibacter bartlettii]